MKAAEEEKGDSKGSRAQGACLAFLNEIFNDLIVVAQAVVRNNPLWSGSLNDAELLCNVATRMLTSVGPADRTQLHQFS